MIAPSDLIDLVEKHDHGWIAPCPICGDDEGEFSDRRDALACLALHWNQYHPDDPFAA